MSDNGNTLRERLERAERLEAENRRLREIEVAARAVLRTALHYTDSIAVQFDEIVRLQKALTAQPPEQAKCPDCNGYGEKCLAGESAHPSNWYRCQTCNGSGNVPPAEQEDVPQKKRLGEDWITHQGGPAPDLHPMRAVAWHSALDPIPASEPKAAKDISWDECYRYRPLTTPDGLPLVMAEGLLSWVEYVATDSDGTVYGYSGARPMCGVSTWQYRVKDDVTWTALVPDAYAAEPWDKSLMAVYREDR